MSSQRVSYQDPSSHSKTSTTSTPLVLNSGWFNVIIQWLYWLVELDHLVVLNQLIWIWFLRSFSPVSLLTPFAPRITYSLVHDGFERWGEKEGRKEVERRSFPWSKSRVRRNFKGGNVLRYLSSVNKKSSGLTDYECREKPYTYKPYILFHRRSLHPK